MSSSLVAKRPVLHVTTVHQPLDTRIYYKEVRALADSGYDVRLATTVDEATNVDGVMLIPLGDRERPRIHRIWRDLRAFFTILSHKRAIVHIHDPELLLVAALPAFAGANVVYDVHEFYSERISASEWLPPRLRRLAANIYDAIERAVLPRFSGIVVVNEAMRARYERFVPRERVALVRNFPNVGRDDLERARAAPHPLDGVPYAIHTGGAMRLRAFHDLVKAAEELAQLQSPLRIVNLGETDLSQYSESEGRELLARANAAGVLMLGSLPYHDALRWLAHARIGYLPLNDTENNRRGMPNKLFEYQLFGLPVVATDIGTVAEIVRTTRAGEVVPAGDGSAHARALVRVHDDEAYHQQLSQAGLEAARTYSFAGEFARLASLYERIGGVPAFA